MPPITQSLTYAINDGNLFFFLMTQCSNNNNNILRGARRRRNKLHCTTIAIPRKITAKRATLAIGFYNDAGR